MRYGILKGASVIIIFIFSTVWLISSAAAFETHCLNDTVKDQGADDVEWVDAGSLDVAWKTTSMDTQTTPINVDVINESGGYEPVPYVLKVNDIDLGHTMARISLAKAEEGAKPKNDILFLNNGTNATEGNLSGENTSDEFADWCQIDHELKVRLTGMTEDAQKTPHIQFTYYKRGNPKLEFTFESKSDDNNSEQANGTTYLPEKERDVKVTVKNSGEAWVESIKLDVNLTDFDLVNSRANLSETDIQTRGNHLNAEMGWLAKNEERSINFTIRSPSWSDINSRLKLNPVNITVNATGDDILGYEHRGNGTLSLNPPEPDIDVSQLISPFSYSREDVYKANHDKSDSNSTTNTTGSSSSNEISMSSWYIKGSEVHGLKGFFAVRQTVHNVQGYYLNNVSFAFPPIPEGLIIGKVDQNENLFGDTVSVETIGDSSSNPFNGTFHKSLSGMKTNQADYILIPTRPGTYQLGSFSVNSEYEGHTLSKTSEAASLIVHGPHVLINKSVEDSGDGKVDVVVSVKNDGDRVATANLTDRVPAEAGMVRDSINISRNGQPENDSLPLRDWELATHKEKDSTSILMNFPLRPAEYYDVKYSVQPGNLSNLDLPAARIDFIDLNAYKGTIYSSFFKSGAEVKQAWDYYDNKWKVTSGNWDDSNGSWEEGWDPIANRWANETILTSDNDTELNNSSLTVPSGPPEEKSTFDKIKDFLVGLLPWGKKGSEQSNLSAQPAQNNSGNESFIVKVRNFLRGILPGGKQKNESSSPANGSLSPDPSVTPIANPSNNQPSGSD